MFDHEPIHVTVPGTAGDPRSEPEPPPGVVIHRVPELHPDDVTVIDGIPCTSVARTLVDLAEIMSPAELRATFGRARAMGLLDIEAVKASAARVEWRPSLAMLYEVIDEFGGDDAELATRDARAKATYETGAARVVVAG